MSLLGWLGRQAQGVEAQVNPFDHGQTYNTVTQNRVPGSNAPIPQPTQAPRPAAPVQQPGPQPDQRSGLSKLWDQVNPFDSGRTWKAPAIQTGNPNANGSFLHQLTHNGVTNVAGDVVKPFSNMVATPVESGRSLIAQLTHNNAAMQAAEARKWQDVQNSAPGIIGKNLYYIGKANTWDLADQALHPNKNNDQYMQDINKTAIGQLLNIPEHKLAEYQVHRDLKGLTPEQTKAAISANKSEAGLDPNANLFTQGVNTAMGAAQLAAPTWGFTKAMVEAGVPAKVMGGISSAGSAVKSGATATADAAKSIPIKTAATVAKADDTWNFWNDRYSYANEMASKAPNAAERAQWNDAAQQMAANRNARFQEITQGGYVKNPFHKETPQPAPVPEQPKATPLPKDQQRGTIKTLKQSGEVSQATKDQLKGTPLTRRPHTPMREAAQAAVDNNLQGATEKAYKDLNQTPGRMTDTQQMNAIKVAQTHDAMGNHEIAADIYNKLATHRSRTAQALSVGQELSKRTPEGIRYAAQKTLEKAGVKFEGDVADKVNALMNDIRSTKPGTDERAIATQKLIHEVNNRLPRSKMQAGIDLWRAGLLTGPETVAKVATSHLIVTPMELGVRPVAAATDAAVAHLTPKPLLRMLTRNKSDAVKPGERTVTFNPLDYAKGTKGAVEGGKAAYTHLKTGIDLPNTGGFEHDLGAGTKQTAYEKSVYRVHGSVYKSPYRMGYRIEEANQLRLAKDVFGNDSEAIAKRMASPKVQKAMTDYAEQFAMQNKTEAGHLAQTIQQFKPGGVPIGQWIAPFSRIPAAIGVKGIVDYTPLGTVRAMKTLYDGFVKGTFDQRKFAESMSRSAVGGTALVGAGAMLMASGHLTLQEPSDPKEKALWQAEGKQRNSIRVNGKWISLNAMGPVGIALGIGGAWERARSGGSNGTNAVAQAIGAGGKLLADQPYMKGVTGVGNVLQDPVRYAESYLRNSATSFVPAGVQQTARGTDSQQRAYPDNLKDAIKQTIPGQRENTPAQNDIFGTVIKGQAGESGRIGGVINPFFPSSEKNQSDPATKELQRLYDSLGTKSVAIQPTTQYTGPDGKPVKLTTAQQQQMLAATGPSIHQAVNDLIQNPSYQKLTDDQKVSKLNDVFNAYQNQYVKANFNPNQKVSTTQNKLMTSDVKSLDVTPKTKSTRKSGSGSNQPSIPKETTTTYDQTKGVWVQTNHTTGRVTQINPDGSRVVLNKGTSSSRSSGTRSSGTRSGGSSKTVFKRQYSASGITSASTFAPKINTKAMRSLLTQTFKKPPTSSSNPFRSRTSNKPVLVNAGRTKITKGRRVLA